MNLPPLPETNTVPRDYYTREQIQSYAKLAVREALERVIQSLDCDATARAMLKDYE